MDDIALSKYFSKVHNQPSILGKLDCVSFVADAAYIGWDADYREKLKYNDRRSAVDRLRKADGLENALIDALGDPVGADELEPGDVAYLFPSAIGIVMPDYIAVKHRRTIIRVDKSFALKGWKLKKG